MWIKIRQLSFDGFALDDFKLKVSRRISMENWLLACSMHLSKAARLSWKLDMM